MSFAHPRLKLDQSARRFLIWMAIGTAFILTLVAADYFQGGPIW